MSTDIGIMTITTNIMSIGDTMIKWPDFKFPPINLWCKPHIDIFDNMEHATRVTGKRVVITFKDYDNLEQFLKLYDKRKQN